MCKMLAHVLDAGLLTKDHVFYQLCKRGLLEIIASSNGQKTVRNAAGKFTSMCEDISSLHVLSCMLLAKFGPSVLHMLRGEGAAADKQKQLFSGSALSNLPFPHPDTVSRSQLASSGGCPAGMNTVILHLCQKQKIFSAYLQRCVALLFFLLATITDEKLSILVYKSISIFFVI